jgi:hypothetical protein
MHKIIVIFLIYTSFSSIIYSYSAITVTSQTDWDAGQASNGLTTGQTGAIRLTSGFINGYDDFEGGLRSWWTPVGSSITFAGGLELVSSAFLSPVGLWSQAFASTQDFEMTVSINATATAPVTTGELGLDVGNQVIGLFVFGQNVSFVGTGGVSSSVSVPVGFVQLRLQKVGQTYSGECRGFGASAWTYLGARTLAAGQQVFYLGHDPVLQNSLPHAYFDNFEISPIISQGSWTSTSLNLSGVPTTQGTIKWSQDLPTGTQIQIQTATSPDGSNWSNWSAPCANNFGSEITSPSQQYIRVAATLYSDVNQEFSPVLKDINIVYPDAVPSKPIVDSITHPVGLWSNKNPMQITWSMPGNNPAPESSYKYWLAVATSVTQTATGTGLTSTAGQFHPLIINLPQEGQYTFGLTVTADAFSGGLTATSIPYEFNYDSTPPGQVNISSPTHPPLLFTNNNSPVFKLSAIDAMSGISGYATVLDKAATGEPGIVVNSGPDIRFSRLDNGTYYLHARAIDLAGNTGPVSHYGIRIDFNGALLAQDYVKALPNPVRSDTAHLEYELAAPATEVYLEFMNSQGELLKTVDGSRIVGKNYYNWDVSGLANGVYLFRVKAKSSEDGKAFSVVRKVAVIR